MTLIDEERATAAAGSSPVLAASIDRQTVPAGFEFLGFSPAGARDWLPDDFLAPFKRARCPR